MEAIKNTRPPEETGIEMIQRRRDDLFKDFLDERYIKEYLALKYNVKDLSNVKIEFIKKGVKELLLVPVDVRHYESIFATIIESEGVVSTEGNQLFYAEIEKVLMRYLY